MSDYAYEKAEQPDSYKLSQDIAKSPVFSGVVYAGTRWEPGVSKFTVVFQDDLTTEQEEALDDLVAALPSGDSTPKKVTTVVDWNVTNANSSNPVWTRVGSFIYCPHCFDTTPNKCAFVAWVDPGVEGQFRVYDVSNNKVVYVSGTLNSADPSLTVGDLSNLPLDMALFEFQVKRTGVVEGRVFVDTVKVVIMP